MGGARRLDRRRPGGPGHLLPRARDGRPLEDDERGRDVLAAHEGRAGLLRRRRRRRPVGPAGGLGRDGRGDRPQQRRLRRRRLPLDGRRRRRGRTPACRRAAPSARIRVHPTDPDVAFVAASGDLWTKGGERGLFKTTDGGKSWTKVLSAAAPDDADTGCVDVAARPPTRTSSTRRSTRGGARRGRSPTAPSLTGGRDAGRHLPVDRRRRHVEEADERPPGADGPHRPRRLRREPEGRHGRRPERRGRDERIDEVESRRGRGLPLGGRRRHLDAHLAPEPAPVLLQPDPDRPGERPARLRPRLRPLRLRRRREDASARTSSRRSTPTATSSSSPERPRRGAPCRRRRASRRSPRKPVSPRLLLGTDGGAYLSADAGRNWAPRRPDPVAGSSTGSPSTTPRRTASAAACRTT